MYAIRSYYDRGERVAGVDRTDEGFGVDHRNDLGNLLHVDQRGEARHHVLAGGGGGSEEGVVTRGEADEEVGGGLGEEFVKYRIVGDQHLGDAVRNNFV